MQDREPCSSRVDRRSVDRVETASLERTARPRQVGEASAGVCAVAGNKQTDRPVDESLVGGLDDTEDAVTVRTGPQDVNFAAGVFAEREERQAGAVIGRLATTRPLSRRIAGPRCGC